MFINTPIYDFDILFIVQIKIYTGDTVKKYRPGGGVEMPIKIKREDGSCTEYRNARLIPAFLMIPEELLRRCGKALYELPRTRAALLGDRAVIRQVESDLFLECIVDAYAYMAWPHMGQKGRLEDWSGNSPCWRVAHAASLWIDELSALGLLYTFPQWLEATELQPTTPFGFVPYETVDRFLSIAVPNVMLRDGYWEWLNYVQKHPCFEDFDEHRYSWQKADFIKKWYHTRTKHPTTLSREVLRIHEIVDGAEAGLLHSNEHSEFEDNIAAKIDMEQFLQTLTETDRKILAMRLKGKPLEEIAKALGFQTHSTVLKRIRKIGKAYERFSGEDYGFSEAKII